MLLLLYSAMVAEVFLILNLAFETPLRKLVVVNLDRFKRVGAIFVVVFLSSLYSILNPTDQILRCKRILEASLFGFVLFLSLMIDRLHHDREEIAALEAKLKERESECEVKGNKIKTLESEVEALKTTEGFLRHLKR